MNSAVRHLSQSNESVGGSWGDDRPVPSLVLQ